ncbi:MAG: helix-turn-helix transcriptional regulator [Faecalibacterium sp.]
MDAKMFGAFLAQVRRAQGLTQAELAEQLHVTDKAVSRWERGVGLPDINTLEPLADALGLSLADLMHCHDPAQEPPTAPVPLEDFFSMLRRQHTCGGLAFCPRCAAPAKYRPGTVGHIRLPRNTCSSLAFPQRWFFTSRWLDVLVGRFSASGRNGISHAGTLEQL